MLATIQQKDILAKCRFCETIFDFKLSDKVACEISDAKNQKRQFLLDLISVFDSDAPNEQRTELLSNLNPVFTMI